MTEQKNKLADLFAACWKDEALRSRFMREPKVVLREHGMDVPEGLDVRVVENTDDQIHITMPARPEDVDSLSDADLSAAAGGGRTIGNLCPKQTTHPVLSVKCCD